MDWYTSDNRRSRTAFRNHSARAVPYRTALAGRRGGEVSDQDPRANLVEDADFLNSPYSSYRQESH